MNVSAHTQKERVAAPTTLKINKMKKNDVNKAAPSVDVPRFVRCS